MRLGILSDIHGNLPGLEACLARLEELGAERILCTGDLVQYGPFPAEVVDLIERSGVETVQGNCDRAVARGRGSTGDSFGSSYWDRLAAESLGWTGSRVSGRRRDFLKKLPDSLRFEVDGVRLLLVHGLPGNITGELPPRGANDLYEMLLSSNHCDVLVTGHSHELVTVRRPGGILCSAGSVGGGTVPGGSTFLVLDVDDYSRPCVGWYRVDFDTQRYREAYEAAGLPEVFLRCVMTGRDQRGRWHTEDTTWRQKWAERS